MLRIDISRMTHGFHFRLNENCMTFHKSTVHNICNTSNVLKTGVVGCCLDAMTCVASVLMNKLSTRNDVN